jgi:hypothetical protein
MWKASVDYEFSYGAALEQRTWRTELVQSLPLEPRAKYREAAASFWSSRFSRGASVLGVHLRGTDKRTGVVDPATYVPYIRAFLCHHRGRSEAPQIFLATDDEGMRSTLARLLGALPEGSALVSRPLPRGKLGHKQPWSPGSGAPPSSASHPTNRLAMGGDVRRDRG